MVSGGARRGTIWSSTEGLQAVCQAPGLRPNPFKRRAYDGATENRAPHGTACSLGPHRVELVHAFLARRGVPPVHRNALQGQVRSPSRLQAGQELTYSETGGPFTETFDLTEATYELDVLANYSTYDDPDDSGYCHFLADVSGGETPASFDLSDYLDIGGTFTYHVSPVWVLSGQYQLYVDPQTTCTWTVTVLDLGQAVFSRSGRLLPTAVHDEMCIPQAYTDGSDQSQVDLYGTNCDLVTKTLGVDAAREGGRSFRADSFTCLSTVEGPSSQWAASWHGTYYTYGCTAKGAQAAFNWGKHYAFKTYSAALLRAKTAS